MIICNMFRLAIGGCWWGSDWDPTRFSNSSSVWKGTGSENPKKCWVRKSGETAWMITHWVKITHIQWKQLPTQFIPLNRYHPGNCKQTQNIYRSMLSITMLTQSMLTLLTVYTMSKLSVSSSIGTAQFFRFSRQRSVHTLPQTGTWELGQLPRQSE